MSEHEESVESPITPRAEVEWFAVMMEKQLAANDHKPGWHRDSLESLLERAKEELSELDDAITSGEDPEVIIREAADVANFAMMIARQA